MGRPPSADAAKIRGQIIAYLAAHDGRATQPEIRRHLVATYGHSSRIVERYTATIIRTSDFQLERISHQGPRTIHVRLAPRRCEL